MKIFIAIIVVLLHVAFVLCLLQPGTRQEEPADALPDTPGQTSSDAGGEAGGESALGTGLQATTFSVRDLTPPADLRRQTGICKTGVLLDWDGHEILWRKDAEKAVPIASMTKMMTALLLIEDVDAGAASLEAPVQVTAAAADVGGSQVYLDPRESLTLDELLKCMMIFSANDAAHLAAEFLAGGNVDAFVKRMNARAVELGLTKTAFRNPHGLPPTGRGRQNQGTAMEMAYLAGQLLKHPQVVRWSSTWVSYIREGTPKKFQLASRNRLIVDCPGVNGMKTGFTNQAGFCVSATCERQGRTLIAVVTGCPSQKQRNDLVAALLNWGYSQTGGGAPPPQGE